MLSGATVGVGEASTEASCEFGSFFCPLMRGLAGTLKLEPPRGRTGGCVPDIWATVGGRSVGTGGSSPQLNEKAHLTNVEDI